MVVALLGNLKGVARFKAPFLTFAALRTVCNAWCTTTRLGSEDAGCAFGGHGCRRDSVSHYMVGRAAECIQASARVTWLSLIHI